MKKTLAIVIVVDCEKPIELLARTLRAFAKWNAEGINRTDFYILSQRDNDRDLHRLAADFPGPLDVINTRDERVEGLPIWDVRQSLARIRPLLSADYLAVQHAEFLWLPETLERTLIALDTQRPYIVLGNLRRPGRKADDPEWKHYGCRREPSEEIGRLLDRNQIKKGATFAREMPTTTWCHWDKEPKPGPSSWKEDMYFVPLDWLDACRFWDHAGRLPFQDIYDLMGRLCVRLGQMNLLPRPYRLGLAEHTALHLWHEKPFCNFTPALEAWFQAQPAEWKGTEFLNPAIWKEIADQAAGGWPTRSSIHHLRRNIGGTVERFDRAFKTWLDGIGKNVLADYYARHGRDAWSATPAAPPPAIQPDRTRLKVLSPFTYAGTRYARGQYLEVEPPEAANLIAGHAAAALEEAQP